MKAKAICTGFENQGICAMCGGKLGKRRRVYCSDICKEAYEHLFFWATAKEDALVRAKHKCQKCGRGYLEVPPVGVGSWAERSGIDVHHIIPLNGEDRAWHRLNVPSNLLVVCHDCHVLLHTPSKLRELEHQKMQKVMELV